MTAPNANEALVLAGGAAKGSFQVGALGYLYRLQRIAPGIITGTSVGAVNGMKLAEGTDNADLFGPYYFPDPSKALGLAGLESIWLGLQHNSDMYVPTPAFGALPSDIQADLATGLSNRLGSLASEFLAGTVMTGFLGPFGIIADIDVGVKIGDLMDKLKGVDQAGALYQLTPIGTLYDTKIDANKVHDSGIDLLVAMVGLDSGELRYVRYDRIASESAGVPSGNLLARDDLSSSLVVVSMRDAVLGSAADPIFLAAQEIKVAGDLYVDGGVREVAPLRAALQMGATRVFTVLCDVPMTPEDRGKHTDIGGIGLRCLAMAVDEVERGDLEPDWPIPYQGWVIRPGFQVHDGFTIDPALIRIDLDHGYMAAFDAVDGRVRSLRRRELLQDRSARIASLRVQCLALEASVDETVHPQEIVAYGYAAPVKPSDVLPKLRPLKSQIRELMESRLRLGGQFACRPDPRMYWPADGSAAEVTPSQPWNELEVGTLWTQHPEWGDRLPLWPDGYQETGDPALSQDDLDEERRWWIERQGTTGWCFQSTVGRQGDFQLLVPEDDGSGNVVLAHYTRQNDQNMTWVRNADAISAAKGGGVTGAGTVGPSPVSVSVFEGNYGDPPHFEAVVRMRPVAVTESDFLIGLWFDPGSTKWHTSDITVEGKPITVTADPVMFQSTAGRQGDFELLVPQDDGSGNIVLAHYTRLNDQHRWIRNRDAIPAAGDKAPGPIGKGFGPVPVSVSAFQGNYCAPPHYEAIVRMHPAAPTDPDFLMGLWFDPGSAQWYTYDISIEGEPLLAAGDPVVFQSTAGRQGNFELLVPQDDGKGNVVLYHYTRMNGIVGQPWAGPYLAFGGTQVPAAAPSTPKAPITRPSPVQVGRRAPTSVSPVVVRPEMPAPIPISATAFQGNYGSPPSLTPTGGFSANLTPHTNFEAILRARPIVQGGSDYLVGLWYDPGSNQWHSYDIQVNGKPIGWANLSRGA